MQRVTNTLTNSGKKPSGAWRRLQHGAILAALLVGLVPLAGCADFPWNQKSQPQIEENAALDGPSVTHSRPNTRQPVNKPRTKLRKKPANPTPPVPVVVQNGGGPQGAAEPGQPTVPGSTPIAAGISPLSDNTAAGQVASLPNNDAASKPDTMIGRDERGIQALLGPPTKTRTEGSTTVWSYEKDGCSLDLFLFYDVKTGAQRVLSYEIKPNGPDGNATQACYNKFHNV